jgi:Zn-dependent protease with chaperone function
MLARTAKRSITTLACIAAVAASSAAGATGMSIRTLGTQQLYVATIGYRIAAANARACARPEMMSGLVTHDLMQYAPAVRPAITQAFSLTDGFGVLGIVPGSAAERAGLQVDDEILAVGNASVENAAAAQARVQSSAREDQFAATLSQALANGPTALLVKRQGQLIHLTIAGQAGCGGTALLSQSSDLNAWSDGRHVVITSAMMAQAASDDELAFVIAHEMAHNILGHSTDDDAQGLLSLFGIGSGRVRRMEIDADSYAVPLMNSAGYAPLASVGFLERARRRMWWGDLSLDHPSFGRRIKIVTAAIGRLPQRAPAPYVLAQAQSTSVPTPTGY